MGNVQSFDVTISPSSRRTLELEVESHGHLVEMRERARPWCSVSVLSAFRRFDGAHLGENEREKDPKIGADDAAASLRLDPQNTTLPAWSTGSVCAGDPSRAMQRSGCMRKRTRL